MTINPRSDSLDTQRLADALTKAAHWLDTLPTEARKAIHRALERRRKQKPLETRDRQQLVSAIQQAMEHYHHWRLNQTEG